MTMLEIYEQHTNGNKRAFMDAVKSYGVHNFLMDAIEECRDGVLYFDELYKMKNTIKALSGYEGHTAHDELHRIKSMSAFNVQGYNEKTKINQNLTRYHFPDGSRLDIYAARSEGVAFENGQRIATHKLMINK